MEGSIDRKQRGIPKLRDLLRRQRRESEVNEKQIDIQVVFPSLKCFHFTIGPARFHARCWIYLRRCWQKIGRNRRWVVIYSRTIVVMSLNSSWAIFGKISAQPHTIVKQICFPEDNVLFLSLFSLSKNWLTSQRYSIITNNIKNMLYESCAIKVVKN